MSTTDIIRAESLQGTIEKLTELHALRRDLVIPMAALTMAEDGQTLLVPEQGEATIDADGVTPGDTVFHRLDISDVAHAHIAEKLSIPLRYYRDTMHGDHVGLRAHNVNYWTGIDSRKVMLRTYTNPFGGDGLLRALLSDKYAIIDNLDVTMACLAGIVQAGIDPNEVNISGDITDNGRLRLRVVVPGIGANIGDLLGDYRSPFNGKSAAELPMLFAGVEITNSETGGGAFAVTPRVEMEVCTNGMTRTQDVARSVHLGSRLEEGVVEWSAETARRTLDLITSRAADAVATFLSPGYVEGVAAEMRAVADVPVEAQTAVEVTTAALALSEGEQADLLALFGASGQRTAMGVGHAVTALAQSASSDRSAEMEAAFMDVVTAAAKAAA